MKIIPMAVFSVLFLITNTALLAASHHPQEFLKTISGSPNEGEQIVSHYCANCHAPDPLIKLGAPRTGMLSDWEWRLKKGIERVVFNSSEGLNAMPPRGGCFECTDTQLLLAIEAMLPDALRTKEKSGGK